jgi:dihydrofolate reductase
MSKVFVNVGMSLDGFLAGPNGGPTNPLGDGGVDIHQWAFKTRTFLEHLRMEGGESQTRDDEIIHHTFDRTGAYIMGRRMFDEGESNWPEDAPFRAPVFVLTNTPRSPWDRKGGTTFYFSDDTIEAALVKAQKAAGIKDVRISGGASVIQQYLNAGLVDELEVQIAPMFLGKGVRLFDRIDAVKVKLEIVEAINSPSITHVKYSTGRV